MVQQKDTLDRFYTNEDVATDLYKTFKRILGPAFKQIDLFIEPSAGSGAFYNLLPQKKRLGYDLEPACEGVIKQDFYTTDDSQLDAECIAYIGNPPFGRNASDAIKFFNHCAKNPKAHYISFVVPKSFQKSSIQDKLDTCYWLLHDENVPSDSFVYNDDSYDVPCCFQIWQRMQIRRKEFVVPKNIWFEVLKKEDAIKAHSKGNDILAMRRVGGNSGQVLEGLNHNEDTTYFLRLLEPWVRTFLQDRQWHLYNSRTAGAKSISISEILRELERVSVKPISRVASTGKIVKRIKTDGWDVNIWNDDCVKGAKYLPDECIDLLICDPPFGSADELPSIHNDPQKETKVVNGHVEVPENYSQFTTAWLEQAYRVLQPNGSMYIVSGWANSHVINQALLDLGFNVISKIIWKYRTGLQPKDKFGNSHGEIFYCSKSKSAEPYFSRNSRCLDSDMDEFDLKFKPGSLDRESVWYIKTQDTEGKQLPPGKMPDELVLKMLSYSSDVDHLVCDFFLGYGTTAIVARRIGRRVCGFEANPEAYRHICEQINDTEHYSEGF